MKKTILISGGAGFVGSNLVKKLINNENNIIVIDNLKTGNIKNISKWINKTNFKFINYDIINEIQINEKIDEIYHLACAASPPHYQNDPIHTIKTCVYGTINMLELAKKNNAKILLTSTSEIYGDPEIHPQIETYNGNVNSFGPRACYDEGKRIAETLFYNYNKLYNLNIKIARIFNTFGPNMNVNDGRVISNFIIQSLKSKPLTIYGNGSNTRSFQYIDDLINGLVLLMESSENTPINIGNPEEYTIFDIACLIKKLCNSDSEIIYLNKTIDDPKKRKPDITKALLKLNWKPCYNVVEGIKNTIQYFKENL